MDAFLALLSHELRNPLAPMRNALHILRARVPADGQSTWALDVIDRQLEDLVSLIETISEFGRLSNGTVPSPAPLSVRELVADSVRNEAPTFEGKGQAMSLLLPDDPIDAEGDPELLARAIAMMLRQASKSARSGTVIEVSAHSERDRWRVYAGAPMPETSAPEGLPAAEAPATSIGVALVRMLVECHGGSLLASDTALQIRVPYRIPSGLSA
jgi:signal transduction histidine kinase